MYYNTCGTNSIISVKRECGKATGIRTGRRCRSAKINPMLEVYALVIGSFPIERVDRGKLPVLYRKGTVERSEARLEINLSLPVGLNRIYFRSCNFSYAARFI